MTFPDTAGWEGWQCWQVGGESTVNLPDVESCCWCAKGASRYWNPGQFVPANLCFRLLDALLPLLSQVCMTSPHVFPALSWPLDFWWTVAPSLNQGSTLRLSSFLYLASASSLLLSLFLACSWKRHSIVYTLWSHCQSHNSAWMDGPRSSMLWRPLGRFFWEWELWWRQMPGSRRKCSPPLIATIPLCLVMTIEICGGDLNFLSS